MGRCGMEISQSWWEWAEMSGSELKMSGSELKMSESGWEWMGVGRSTV